VPKPVTIENMPTAQCHVYILVGLAGKDDQEAAIIDMLNDQEEDVRNDYYKFIWQRFVSCYVCFYKDRLYKLLIRSTTH